MWENFDIDLEIKNEEVKFQEKIIEEPEKSKK
jgi:hypothetical protein